MRRNFGLDLLRCVAICMVLASHALLFWLFPFGHLRDFGPAATFPLVAILAVEALFVLSGFLIGTMMVRTFEAAGSLGSRIRGFWLRRWFRTVPNYYLFLLVNVLLVMAGVGEGSYSVLHAAFAHNLAGPEAARPVDTGYGVQYEFFFVESWSLALDEWFYLVLPVLVGLFGWLARLPPRVTFWMATLALIAVPTAGRLAMEAPPNFPEWDRSVRRVTLYHLDATGWGVLAAVANRWHPRFWGWRPGLKAAAGLALLVAGMLSWLEIMPEHRWPHVWPSPRLANGLGLAFSSLGFFLALPWVTGIRPSRSGALRRGVVALSNYSYSVYLCHMPLLYVLRAAVPEGEAARLGTLLLHVAVWLAGTIALAAVVHHSFEKPVSDLRERFTRRIDASPFGPAPPP